MSYISVNPFRISIFRAMRPYPNHQTLQVNDSKKTSDCWHCSYLLHLAIALKPISPRRFFPQKSCPAAPGKSQTDPGGWRSAASNIVICHVELIEHHRDIIGTS